MNFQETATGQTTDRAHRDMQILSALTELQRSHNELQEQCRQLKDALLSLNEKIEQQKVEIELVSFHFIFISFIVYTQELKSIAYTNLQVNTKLIIQEFL